jgi:hypothetical protein
VPTFAVHQKDTDLTPESELRRCGKVSCAKSWPNLAQNRQFPGSVLVNCLFDPVHRTCAKPFIEAELGQCPVLLAGRKRYAIPIRRGAFARLRGHARLGLSIHSGSKRTNLATTRTPAIFKHSSCIAGSAVPLGNAVRRFAAWTLRNETVGCLTILPPTSTCRSAWPAGACGQS